jgi:hypothetical protein
MCLQISQGRQEPMESLTWKCVCISLYIGYVSHVPTINICAYHVVGFETNIDIYRKTNKGEVAHDCNCSYSEGGD